MFSVNTMINVRHTDAAGIIFFPRQFDIAQDVHEAFLDHIGFSFQRILYNEDFLFPIVHAESDYMLPLRAGDRITVNASIENIGRTSYTMAFEFRDANGQLAGSVKTVHVALDKTAWKKIEIPTEFLKALQKAKQAGKH